MYLSPQNRIITIFILIVSVVLLNSCKNSEQHSDDEDSISADQPEVVDPLLIQQSTLIELTQFETPDEVRVDVTSFLELKIRAKTNDAIFYKIESENGKTGFIPNSGIIIPNKKSGQLTAKITPTETGEHSFKLVLTDSSHQNITKQFTLESESQ